MADLNTQPTNQPAATGAPAADPTPAPVAIPPATGISAERHAQALQRAHVAESKAQQMELSEATAATAQAQGAAATALADAEKRAQEAEAAVSAMRRHAQQRALRDHLPAFAGSADLVSAVLPMFEAAAQFDEAGQLTAASKEALKPLVEGNAHLFATGAPAPSGTTPMATGAHTVAQDSWSPEDKAMFRAVDVTPGAYREHRNWGAQSMIFGKLVK